MQDRGIVIGWPCSDLPSGELSYLFTDRNEFRLFNSFTEARQYLRTKKIKEEDVVLQCHVYCMLCGKEFFLSEEEYGQDELGTFFHCPPCDKTFDEQR